ncbi:MAG: hypothetical protein LC793_06675 [Thermomicrobia bacterium]|nr:hypothetical protein [Thermomicrobia bacterium]
MSTFLHTCVTFLWWLGFAFFGVLGGLLTDHLAQGGLYGPRKVPQRHGKPDMTDLGWLISAAYGLGGAIVSVGAAFGGTGAHPGVGLLATAFLGGVAGRKVVANSTQHATKDLVQRGGKIVEEAAEAIEIGDDPELDQ